MASFPFLGLFGGGPPKTHPKPTYDREVKSVAFVSFLSFVPGGTGTQGSFWNSLRSLLNQAL
jgi:hypothetical protein